MSKKTFLGVMVVALVAVMAAGALFASNMGFKLNFALVQQGGAVTPSGTSNTGLNTLALPDNRQSTPTLASAKNLMDDIGFNSVQQVSRFLRSSDLFQAYTGRRGGTQGDFSLVPGEAYLVKMATTVNYTPSHY